MPGVVELGGWPTRALWSVVTIAAAWAIGRALAALVLPRLAGWRFAGSRPLADATIRIARARLPRWALLVGAWLAAGYWPLTPEATLLVHNVLFVAGAVSVTLAVAALSCDTVDAYGAVVAWQVTSLTRNVAWSVVVILGLLVILNGLGLSIAPMLTALGVGGLAVALALQEPLGNFFAGVFVTLAGQIRVGDYVRLDSGQEGVVVDFSWRSTRIRMLANNLIIVPNSKLSQSVVTNHHLPTTELAVLVEVGVDYSSDLSRVEQVVGEVARGVMRDVPGGVPEFEPFIRYHTFNDSSIDFTVILRAKEFVDQYLVKHEFIKQLHERFNREGIVIPFPIRTLGGSLAMQTTR